MIKFIFKPCDLKTKQMNHIKKILLASLIVVCCTPLYLHAQPGFGDDVNDSGAPLDGGLSVLAVAGAGYGLKKLKEARKRKGEEKETTDTTEK
jgi:hypothetical protein